MTSSRPRRGPSSRPAEPTGRSALPRLLSTLPLLLAALLLGTILLPDAAPAQAQSTPTVTLSADKNPVREGEQVIFTATLSSAPAADFSIPVTATLVTAEAADLTGSGTIRVDFPSGVTTASFIIHTVEDTDHDDETFIVALGALPSSVTAGATTSLTITIRDYDDALALVSNVGQANAVGLNSLHTAVDGTLINAQQFTTGANTGGYTLTSIEFNMAVAVSVPANMRAELWSSATNGEPDSKLADLAVPSTVGTGNVAFYAPANTTLDASTSYFAVLYATGATEGSIRRTSTDGEDTGAASGWSIANTHYNRQTTATNWDSSARELKIRVNGFPAAPAAGTSVWSATLTPRTLSATDVGCNNTASGNQKCSDATTLTDHNFVYRGETYTFRVLTLGTGNQLNLWLDKGLPAYAKRDLVLTVGSEEFPLADFGGSGGAYGKQNSGLSWTAGTGVTLGLKQRTPTTVTLSAAPNPVTEGSAVTVTVTLSKALASAVQMEATVTAGTAESGDYTALASYPLEIAAGATWASFGIQTNQDDDRDDETLIVTLGSVPSGVEPGETTSLTITITDDEFLVSTIGQTAVGQGNTHSEVWSQGFTTGSASGGYTLSSIVAVLQTPVTAAQRATLRAELWSAATGGGPDSKLADLTVPSFSTTAPTNTVAFAAPASTTLTASTTYYVVIYTVGSFNARVTTTTSDNEDSGGQAGWSVEDDSYLVSADVPGTTNTWSSHDSPLRIRVRGEAATPTTPTVSLSAAPDPVTEGSPVTITATLSAALSSSVSIPVTLTAVTAESGDIGALTSISIASGQTSGTGTITTAQDTDNEDETFTVSLGTLPSSVSAGTPNSVTVTIADDDPTAVTLSAASDTVSEGVAAGLVIVTATLDVGYAAQHSCAVTPGSASTAKVRPEGSSTSDWDWRLYAALVRFNAGAASATFRVAVQDDSAEESAETAIIDIDCTGGVTDSLTLTIEDNDGAPAATLWSATLTVADKTTTEAGCDNGKSGAECSTESVLTDDDFIVGSTTWSVTALLSQKVTGALSMKFNRDVRTALDDYSVCIGARALPFANAAHTGGTTWAEWDGAAADQHWFAGRDPVLVRISGDCSVSYDADLSGLSAKQQTTETAVTGPSLALSPAFSGATTAYTASVANNVTNVRLTPTVNDPGATVKVGAGNDLYPVRSGETSRTLAVRNNGANSFKVVVTAPDGATMKTYTVTVFRAGAGNVPKVSLSALAEVNEGSSLTVEALLSGPLAGDVTIPLTLTPGTAEPGDYGTLASITIPAGQTSASGVIATTRDADTDDETFTVSLAASLPSSVTAGAQPSVRVTIRDLDGAGTATPPEVTLSVGGNPVREGRGISVFVFLSKPMAGSVTIPITLTPGTAEPGDYGTLASVTVTGTASHPSLGYDGKPFAIGRITTSQDDDLDDETLTVSLGTLPSSVTAGEPSSVTVVINDDDKGAGLPTVSLWASPNPVTEGETVTITARLPYNWQLTPSVTVPVLLSAGTAESGDYGALTPASITILRGQSSGTATVATAEDADYADETFTASLGPLPATLGPANTRTSVEVTIADDDDDPDAPRAYIVAVPADVLEGGTVTVRVWLTKRPGRDVTIPITVTHVTSEPGDLAPLNPASITIPANKASGEVTLQINWDADGDDETFTVSLGRLPSSVVRGGPEGPYANFSGPSKVTILDRGTTSSDAIWSATLTPQANALGTDPGCSNIVANANCNSASVLTETEFTVGGAATSITLIRTTSTGSEMSVNFSTSVRTALAGHQFCVGARGFPFSSDAFSGGNNVAAWTPSPALAFTVGSSIALSIVPPGSGCSAGAAPPPHMLVWGSDGWLTLTWRAPDYISRGAIVRWRLKDADPNTAGDQPGAWTPANGVLLRSEQHDARRATLPPWDCANCVPLVPGKLYEVGLRLITETGYSDWGLAGEGVPVSAWPLQLVTDSGAIPHGGSVTVTARLGYPAKRLMWLRFDTEGDGGAARWGPDCDWEHGATDIIGPGQTEATVKLCATAGVTMTVKARILDTDIAATPIRVRALGPNPPTAITLSADPQAVANGGPVTVTARLDRPTAPGLTVRLNINGLGAAWWDHCDPPRRYRGTWGGKVIEIPPGGQEATAELCVKWRDGPPLEIAAWSAAPRLQAKTLSLQEPASLVLRSLTVSSTDPQEGLPENAVDLSDASNDYAFSVPRAVSSVTVKPAAAYETTSVKVNGRAVDAGTPAVDVPLDVGDNTITIEVRAPAVPAVREYTLTVTRHDASTDKETRRLARPECDADTGPLCGIALSAGSEALAFSPDFTRETTSYRATVPAGTTSVTLTPDFADGTSVFTGSRHGATTYTRPTRVRPSGTAVELALAPDGGATELWLMVSGSGGMTTYRIDVTEAPPAPPAGVTVTPTTLSVAEDGRATYTVSLDSRPTADVTVTVASGDAGAASVSPASYTFTPSGWNISQIFIVSGVADADTDDESVTITHRAASSDAGYDGIAVASVAVTVTDDTPEQQQQQAAEPVEIPGPVVNLQLTARGEKVIVSWEAPASGGPVDNYIAHLKPTDGGDGKTHRPRAGKTTTTFRNLEPGATYRVWVRARNEAGKGERVHARVTLPDGVVRGGEGDPPPEQESGEQETGPPVAGQIEPYNVQVTPGDGTLTVTWTVAPREGFEDAAIRHALRWSQQAGVWANPAGPNASGPNDGVSVEGGVATYTITGLRNGVATGVFIRSFTGGDYNEGSPTSSQWVRIKGENTTPRAAG